MTLILRRPKAVSKDEGRLVIAIDEGGLTLRDAILQIAPQGEEIDRGLSRYV